VTRKERLLFGARVCGILAVAFGIPIWFLVAEDVSPLVWL
jgi:hypothetical protein